MQTTGGLDPAPENPILCDKHVLLHRADYDHLVTLELRAKGKLTQLKEMTLHKDGIVNDIAHAAFIRCLEWLLGESPW